MNNVSLENMGLASAMTGVMHPIAEKISLKYHPEIPHWRLYQILAEFSGEVVREFLKVGENAPSLPRDYIVQEQAKD